MTADPNREDPHLVRQHAEKNRKCDRELAKKPDKPVPETHSGADQITSDDDQRGRLREQQPRIDRPGGRSAT